MNIAELFARIGLKTDEDKAKSFSRAMTTVKVGLIAATAVAAGTANAIRKITSEAMQAAVAFNQFEIETGASAQELQKWQSVAEQTNQSAESVTSAIKAIVSNQEKIRLGQGDISGYQILGIDPRQDPFKILEDLREKTKGLSEGMKKNILSQIGVGAGMLQTLNLTREQFDEMAGRAWIISPQAIKTLNETKSAMALARRSVNYMKTQIAVGLSPQIKKVTKDFQEWMKVNEKGIIEGFKLGFKYVTMFVKAVYNAASMLNRIVTSTIGWKAAIGGLIGVILALNAALLLSPIGMITAGFILLIAILDDLYTYSQGGKSVFGEMMKEFPDLEKTIFGVFGTIKEVFQLMKAFATGDISGIEAITEKWGKFGDIVRKIYTGFQELMKLKDQIIDNFFDAVIEKFPDFERPLNILRDFVKFATTPFKIFSPSESIMEAWKILSDSVKLVYDMFDKLQNIDPLESIKDTLSSFLPTGFFGKGETGGGTSNQTNNITQNIYGSGDPTAVGDAAAKSMQKAITAASAQIPRSF